MVHTVCKLKAVPSSGFTASLASLQPATLAPLIFRHQDHDMVGQTSSTFYYS